MARRKKQGELAGFERPCIKDLEDASLAYVFARDAKMEAGADETDKKSVLSLRMISHAKELERNGNGEICYKFVHGYKEHTVTMKASEIKPEVKSKDVESKDIEA